MSLPPRPRTVAPSPQVPTDDRVGFELHRGDRNLGDLEEIVILGRDRYYVVDARHWSFGTRKLVPVQAVTSVDPARRRALTHVDPEVIRHSPDFDPFLLSNRDYAERVRSYFAGTLGRADGATGWPASGPPCSH